MGLCLCWHQLDCRPSAPGVCPSRCCPTRGWRSRARSTAPDARNGRWSKPFCAIPRSRATRLRGASDDDLDRWLDARITDDDLCAVFESSPGRRLGRRPRPTRDWTQHCRSLRVFGPSGSLNWMQRDSRHRCWPPGDGRVGKCTLAKFERHVNANARSEQNDGSP